MSPLSLSLSLSLTSFSSRGKMDRWLNFQLVAKRGQNGRDRSEEREGERQREREREREREKGRRRNILMSGMKNV